MAPFVFLISVFPSVDSRPAILMNLVKGMGSTKGWVDLIFGCTGCRLRCLWKCRFGMPHWGRLLFGPGMVLSFASIGRWSISCRITMSSGVCFFRPGSSPPSGP